MTDRMKLEELKDLIGELDHSYKNFDDFKKDFMSTSIDELLSSVWEVYKITKHVWVILNDKNTER